MPPNPPKPPKTGSCRQTAPRSLKSPPPSSRRAPLRSIWKHSAPRKSDGLNPWRGDIRLLSLKVEGRDPWLIDLQSTGYDLGPLSTALESVLGHRPQLRSSTRSGSR